MWFLHSQRSVHEVIGITKKSSAMTEQDNLKNKILKTALHKLGIL